MTGSVLAPGADRHGAGRARLAPYDPILQDQRASLRSPGPAHLLGTDVFGRDILSRVVWGGRQSLRVGILAVAVGGRRAALLGLLAGYYRGLTGTVILRLTDLLLALPGILLALTIVAATGPQPGEPHRGGRDLLDAGLRARVSSTAPCWTCPTRTSSRRAAPRGPGLGVLWRHVVPNILAPVIVLATLGLGNALIDAATLSFLGLGAQPPTPRMGRDAEPGPRVHLRVRWIATFPGVAILLAAVGANLLGEGMRDLLDPRLRV